MNFLEFTGAIHRGDRSVRVNGAAIEIPEVREDEAEGTLALGVRPEHVSLDDASSLRGRVFGVEYLGTTQIVTIETPHGRVKARSPSSAAARIGDIVGLNLDHARLSVFDVTSGRALQTALHQRDGLG
jgi:multiple sugar transport system ATP-binding protein